MDIRDIEAVVAVNDFGSYFEAAYQINMSRTTLSRRISHLEEELNITIFSRATKSQQVSLTEEGQRLLPLLQNILLDECNILNLCDELNKDNNTIINLGYRSSFYSAIRKKMIMEFLNAFPSYSIRSKPGYDNDLIRNLTNDIYDCIILPVIDTEIEYFRSILPPKNYTWIPIHTYNQLRLGMSTECCLSSYDILKKEDFGKLKDYTFVFDAVNLDKHPAILESFLGIEHMKKRFLDFSDPEIIVSILSNAQTVLPVMIDKPDYCGLNFVPIDGYPYPLRLYLIFKKTNLSKALRQFTKFITTDKM